MNDTSHPLAIRAADVPPRAKRSTYPEPFFSRMAGRDKRPLGDLYMTGLGYYLFQALQRAQVDLTQIDKQFLMMTRI